MDTTLIIENESVEHNTKVKESNRMVLNNCFKTLTNQNVTIHILMLIMYKLNYKLCFILNKYKL